MPTALLIIDVQQALCDGEWAVSDAPSLIDHMNVVSRAARQAGVPVVFIQHEEAAGALQHGADGWQLASGLETAPGDLFVRKTACDSFHRTDLQSVLEAHGITALVVGGLQTEFCVDTTVRRALALGYPVTLVEDGHSTMNTPVLSAAQIVAHHNHTLANMESFGPRVTLVPAGAVSFAA